MVWAGSPFAHYVEFSTGLPTGAVSFELLDHTGAALTTGTVTPAQGAVGQLITINGSYNTCTLPLMEIRTLTYSYTTATGLVSDRIGYRVDRPIPLGVSPEGVRSKLGLSEHEIKDAEVQLLEAYAEFLNMVGSTAITTAAAAGDRTTLLAIGAVEALAALSLLPSLQLRAAQRETSGTNEFSRFNSIDWDMLRDELLMQVSLARATLDPTADTTGGDVFSFGTAPREFDAVTGS